MIVIIKRFLRIPVLAVTISICVFLSCCQTPADGNASGFTDSLAAQSESSGFSPDTATSFGQASAGRQGQNTSKSDRHPSNGEKTPSNTKTGSEPIVLQPVTVYTGASFSGASSALVAGAYRFADIGGLDGRQIGSVKVPSGMRIRLLRQKAYGGGFICFEENEYDLTNSGWSQNIESVVVEAAAPETDKVVLGYNYILGTQAFNPLYHFSDKDGTYEAALRIYQMGSNAIKMRDTIDYDAILKDMDFRYVYLWLRTDNINWRDGLSDMEEEIEYDYMYEAVKRLLTVYNNSGTSFYLGHWEGDWYLIDNYNTEQKTISQTRIQGMIDWLNIRQKAIDDAKRDVPHKNIYVWGYTEANRTCDVFTANADRLANRVLPYVNIDYLSYSAYDIQGMGISRIKSYLEYMESKLKPKAGVPGKRILIGETGLPSVLTQNSQHKHNSVNLDFFIKYFDSRTGQILYWQMYNNEQSNGVQQGFWLIDNNNVKWKLYYSFKAFYDNGREYVRQYNKSHGKAPDLDTFSDWASSFLKTLQ